MHSKVNLRNLVLTLFFAAAFFLSLVMPDSVMAAKKKKKKDKEHSVLRNILTLDDVDSLINAIEDISKTYGKAYKKGDEYLAQAKLIRKNMEKGKTGQDAFKKLQYKALIANPLLTGKPILFTVHAQDKYGTHIYMRPTGFQKYGSSLKVLDLKTGKTHILVSAPKGIIRRPDVHFDGKKIIFAMSKNARDKFHIYEIDAAPSGIFNQSEFSVKQLTTAPDVSDVDPIYLPDDKIAFASTRDIKYVPCADQIVPQLFRMDSDGANIHQITRSTAHENEISLMPDGRILYSRWDYVDRNFGDGHGFWVTNPDGCNQALIWGNNTAHPSAGWTARMIPGSGKILCILGTHHSTLGGAMAILDPRKSIDGRKSIERTWPSHVINRFDNPEKFNPKKSRASDVERAILTWPEEARALLSQDANMRLHAWFDTQADVRPWYNSPYPLNKKYFLCVRAEQRKGAPAIYLVDIFGNQVMLYQENPGCYSPIPFTKRLRPLNISLMRDYKNDDGYFYIQNVYKGTHMKGVEFGSIKSIRIVEIISKRGLSRADWKGLGRQSPAMNWTDFNAKRILGTAPVEKDGSASFYVPSDRYVYFQLLNKEGMMVQSMRSGTSIHSGEKRGCVGCHEPRASAVVASVDNTRTMATKRKPDKLKPWLGRERVFSYMKEVQPVFEKHCIKCHDFDGKGAEKVVLAGDKDFAFNTSYGELWYKGYVGAIGAGPAAHLPAKTWGSLVSPLIKILRKGHHNVDLEKESMNRLITWIDLNGPYYPTTYAARRGIKPGRNPLTKKQTKQLIKLTGMKLKSLGLAGSYNGPKVSFDRPEMSPCLQKMDKNSEKYKKALAIIKAGRKSLKEKPRADMPGFVPYKKDRKRQAHHKKYSEIEQKVRQAIREGTKVMDFDKVSDETMGL